MVTHQPRGWRRRFGRYLLHHRPELYSVSLHSMAASTVFGWGVAASAAVLVPRDPVLGSSGELDLSSIQLWTSSGVLVSLFGLFTWISLSTSRNEGAKFSMRPHAVLVACFLGAFAIVSPVVGFVVTYYVCLESQSDLNWTPLLGSMTFWLIGVAAWVAVASLAFLSVVGLGGAMSLAVFVTAIASSGAALLAASVSRPLGLAVLGCLGLLTVRTLAGAATPGSQGVKITAIGTGSLLVLVGPALSHRLWTGHWSAISSLLLAVGIVIQVAALPAWGRWSQRLADLPGRAESFRSLRRIFRPGSDP